MVEKQRKKTEEANKLLSEVNVPSRVKEYLQSLQRIQERWIEQLKKTTEVMENFVKKKIRYGEGDTRMSQHPHREVTLLELRSGIIPSPKSLYKEFRIDFYMRQRGNIFL
jgi:hypothetical protein